MGDAAWAGIPCEPDTAGCVLGFAG